MAAKMLRTQSFSLALLSVLAAIAPTTLTKFFLVHAGLA